jgi:aminopeptidase N
VHLGYRLGHIKNDSRIFRALVYNKGASVLHMLRRLVGDEVFFTGLRTFYEEQKYRKAGTDDLRRVLEAASGKPLERFFERWIYESGIPTIRFSTIAENGALVVRFEQSGDLTYDLPVTVSVTTTTGRISDVVVPLTESVVEHRITVDGPVRQVQVNRDNAALANFEPR